MSVNLHRVKSQLGSIRNADGSRFCELDSGSHPSERLGRSRSQPRLFFHEFSEHGNLRRRKIWHQDSLYILTHSCRVSRRKKHQSAGIRVYSIIEQQRRQCSLVQTIAPKSYIPISRYVPPGFEKPMDRAISPAKRSVCDHKSTRIVLGQTFVVSRENAVLKLNHAAQL